MSVSKTNGSSKDTGVKPTTNLYVEPTVFFRFPLIQIIICPLLLLAVDVFLTNNTDPIDWSNPISGLAQLAVQFFTNIPSPSWLAVKLIVVYTIFETLLLRFVPGKDFLGPVSPMGDQPKYKLNGLPCFFITIAAFAAGSTEFGAGFYSMGIVHENLGEIILTAVLSVKLIVLFLYFKGVYAPSGRDNFVKEGDFWYSYFWGVELYPYVGSVSLKQLVNCRLGMMSWPVIVISCCFSQRNMFGYISTSMLLSAVLQMVYLYKFYLWESGYFGSIDIMHDRFGYYLCWGCLCWIPGFYTSPGLWLAYHPIDVPYWLCGVILVLGISGTVINYLADLQRQNVRETNGNCTIWGKKPETIKVEYVTIDGKRRENILLVSGWWGISRHFHYLPELFAAFCWCAPALNNGLFPYSYFFMLVCLLFDRQLRDEVRCSTKYGKGWTKYCERVPWKIIPYVY